MKMYTFHIARDPTVDKVRGYTFTPQHIWRIFTVFLVVVVGMHVQVISAVRIGTEQQQVKTDTSSTMVTLPCLYYTTSPHSPRIDWFHLMEKNRSAVISVGTGNDMVAYGDYRKRVARGDGASLILIGPRSRDEGLYMCEVNIENDSPSSAVALVKLQVNRMAASHSRNCSETLNCNTDTSGVWALIIIDWIIPMCCVYAFPEGYKKFQVKLTTLGNLVIGAVVGFVVSATILLTVSIRFLSGCSTGSRDDPDSRWTVGLPTGIIGDMLIIALVVFMVRIKATKEQEKGTSVTAQDKIEEVEESVPLEIDIEEVVSTPQIRIVKVTEAHDDVHCMAVAENNNNIYMSTDHSVCLYDTQTDKFEEIHLANVQNIFMILSEDGELVISTVGKEQNNSFKGKFRSSTRKKNVVYIYDPNTETETINKLGFISTAPWLYVNQKGEWCVTDKQSGLVRVLKGKTKLDAKSSIGESFLESPCCVIQNSRADYIIADIQRNEVYVFQDNGEFRTSLRVKNSDGLVDNMVRPFQLAVDKNDNIYVACKDSGIVLVFSSTYEFLRSISFSSEEDATVTAITVNNNDSSLYAACGHVIKKIAFENIDLEDSTAKGHPIG